MKGMTAVVIRNAGGPEVLVVESLPVPDPKPGWVLIRVRAFGLNRSELFTRQGHAECKISPRPRDRGCGRGRGRAGWRFRAG
jgi:NADPH:quinone reductase-like Zn-dependent oxidoreductase